MNKAQELINKIDSWAEVEIKQAQPEHKYLHTNCDSSFTQYDTGFNNIQTKTIIHFNSKEKS
jgi:hypothetical protein